MRKLAPELKARFDLTLNMHDPIDVMLSAASSLIGTNANDCDTIDFIRRTITKPWHEPWCVDFVQTCVAYAETISGILTPLPATEGVVDLWDRAPLSMRVPVPAIGDIILWRIGGTLQGHCGLITGIDSLAYATIEGNTSDSAGIVRTGDGVYPKKRAKGGTRTFVELGFLRVFSA